MDFRSTQTRVITLIIGFSILILLAFLASRAIVQEKSAGFDLLAHWKGSQLLIQENQDPYLATTNSTLQDFLRSVGWTEEFSTSQFNNPLFSLMFYAPLTLVRNVENVRIVWMTLNFLFLISVGTILYSLLKLRVSVWLLVFLSIFLLISFQSYSTLSSGSLSIVSLVFLLLSLNSIMKSNEEAAGLLLAFSLVDPEFSGITVLFLLIWSAVNSHFRILGWFLVTLLFLIGFSMLFLPIWPVHYIVSFFTQGFWGGVSSDTTNQLLTKRLILAKDIGLLVILIAEWFVARKQTPQRLIWLVFLTIPVSLLITGSELPANGIAILPAVFLSVQVFSRRVNRAHIALILVALAVIFLLSWLLSGVLLPGVLGFTPRASSLILMLVILIILYWIRWWINHPAPQQDA
jgi:hypothetical protein